MSTHYGTHQGHDREACEPHLCGLCPPKATSGKFDEEPRMEVVADHRELKADQWVVERFGIRSARWRARCACGSISGVLTTAGMVAGWRAEHLDQVQKGLVLPGHP